MFPEMRAVRFASRQHARASARTVVGGEMASTTDPALGARDRFCNALGSGQRNVGFVAAGATGSHPALRGAKLTDVLVLLDPLALMLGLMRVLWSFRMAVR